MSNLIAIKLGSSNTSIYKQGEGLVLFEPSYVAYEEHSGHKTVVAVGNNAQKMQGRTDERIEVTSPIIEGRVKDLELATIMLKSFIVKIIPSSFIKPKIKAVICLPLGLNLKERKAIEQVCNMSGIQDVIMVPAVLCGAIGYNLPVESVQGLCVVDIGGGSTDIVISSSNSIINGVNVGIGGKTLDQAVEHAIEVEYNLRVGEGTAKRIKEEIGSLYPRDASNAEVSGIDVSTSEPKTIVVDAGTIHRAVVVFYEKIAEAIIATINSSPANIIEDIQNQGIYIMGGASLITGAEQFFRKRLNLPVSIQDYTTAVDTIGAGKLLSDARLLKIFSRL